MLNPMTTFLLIRHGTTDMFDRGISGRAPGIDLNAHGQREVRSLAHRLRERRLAAIYTSPIERTRQTAEVVGTQLGLTPIPSDALVELDFGDWTLQRFHDLALDPRWKDFNEFRSGTRIPDGELMLETQARAVALILKLREEHPDEQVALVTHGDVIKATLAYFLGMPLDFHTRFEIGSASCSELEIGDNFVRVLNLNTIASNT